MKKIILYFFLVVFVGFLTTSCDELFDIIDNINGDGSDDTKEINTDNFPMFVNPLQGYSYYLSKEYPYDKNEGRVKLCYIAEPVEVYGELTHYNDSIVNMGLDKLSLYLYSFTETFDGNGTRFIKETFEIPITSVSKNEMEEGEFFVEFSYNDVPEDVYISNIIKNAYIGIKLEIDNDKITVQDGYSPIIECNYTGLNQKTFDNRENTTLYASEKIYNFDKSLYSEYFNENILAVSIVNDAPGRGETEWLSYDFDKASGEIILKSQENTIGEERMAELRILTETQLLKFFYFQLKEDPYLEIDKTELRFESSAEGMELVPIRFLEGSNIEINVEYLSGHETYDYWINAQIIQTPGKYDNEWIWNLEVKVMQQYQASNNEYREGIIHIKDGYGNSVDVKVRQRLDNNI